jgi:hypothetical protein
MRSWNEATQSAIRSTAGYCQAAPLLRNVSLDILVRWPILALIPAVLFTAFARWSRHPAARAAAAAWALYAVYEFLVSQHVLCSGECNIRIDLIPLYPALAAVSAFALIAGSGRGWRRQ